MVCVLALLAVAAAPTDDVVEARKHYEAGRALYSVDRFAEAAAEFEAGFSLARRPLFLFNAAQAWRRLGEVTNDRATLLRARSRYTEYLTIAAPQDPERDQSREKLALIEQWFREHPAPADAPTLAAPGPTTPSPPPTEPTVVVTPPAPTRAEPERGFFAEHPWVLFVAGGVVLAGASVGTYFGVRQAQGGCATASLGCLDARR